MNYVLLCFASVFFSATTWASNESILSEIDQYLNHPSFEKSFNNGDMGVFRSKSCIADGLCDQYELQLYVKVIDNNTIHMVKNHGKPNESYTLIERKKWDSDQGNRVRTQLATTASYGFQIELSPTEKVSCSYQIGKKTIQDECLQVLANLQNQGGQKGTLKFLINKNLGGLGQIILKSQRMVGLEETTFLRLDSAQ